MCRHPASSGWQRPEATQRSRGRHSGVTFGPMRRRYSRSDTPPQACGRRRQAWRTSSVQRQASRVATAPRGSLAVRRRLQATQEWWTLDQPASANRRPRRRRPGPGQRSVSDDIVTVHRIIKARPAIVFMTTPAARDETIRRSGGINQGQVGESRTAARAFRRQPLLGRRWPRWCCPTCG